MRGAEGRGKNIDIHTSRSGNVVLLLTHRNLLLLWANEFDAALRIVLIR